ncbi:MULTISPECIES: DUF5052 family protein [Clostridium]|jgi:hypothetical protein|uniref:DUF5052 family protein n=1 Tax=Clostridium saccharoperbutylacetonicum N1-4(HMT) TaxID=931276 RepID=M1MCN1_9CLOT|nr:MULTISPECIES: DUF5052 family protein [Clostridium]AGF55664.1 hypothetical protein Cspa_c18940 [Clostridium saccharoperbutylacetonicum N1-4(HMT)]NRT63610.1 hypothetical protein [Clostridium saccharoperbutylacetonicum]NSB26973.1 hypothetical protein [Clostridium saccharoperbutylacetonicum]NSB30221.1 hypothetical protein [Clostridium saccharoperbutylacetonicum]NSB40457.1 hypothetical protein [Clostridium saccharoperbutylacetonicum]
MKKKLRPIILVIAIVLIGISVFGCAKIKDLAGKIKGDLVGQQFTVTTYDDYGNKTLTVEGSKVTVGLLQNSDNFDKKASEFKSEVLEVTVNGNQMFQVGNTVIFAENGLDMIEGYDVPTDVNVNKGGGYVPLDRFVNDVKNKIGKDKTIIISSQQGIPIGVYQGKDVYVTIPEDLPKMTRINIDGKTLYIHRANYTILDSKMIKGK